MALWSNTADGWGSDAGKSGNGQLGTYLQSSLASAPTSPSEKQAADPSNSMPTASISRMAQPSVTSNALTTTPAVTGGVIPQSQLVTPATSQVVSGLSSGQQVDVMPTAPIAPTVTPTAYTGQQYVKYTDPDGGDVYYMGWNPQKGGYEQVGLTQTFNGVTKNYGITQSSASTPFADGGKVDATKGLMGVMSYANSQHQTDINTFNAANKTAQDAAQQTATKAYYAQYLQKYGTLPPTALGGQGANVTSLDATDAKLRSDALAEYQSNQAGAKLLSQGVTPVDMSQQDAINQSSIAALASRYSTNISKGDIGSMGRLYASALSSQSGVNHQLSDEAYATGFNRNMANFNQAVQNQATVDAAATGQKLQTDITAMGDVIAKLQQQTKQLVTSSGNQINDQLNDLQAKINDYKAKADKYGADAAEVVTLGKVIIGAVVGVTAIALAPVTGGASVAGGAALAAAVAKS